MNQCLAQLSEAEYLLLESHFKLVSLPKGKLLYDPGDRIKNFLFPITAKVAIGTSIDEENFTEIAVIGAEGMIGRRLLIDGISSHRVYVSVAGFAYEISESLILQEFRKLAGVHDICVASIEQLLLKISTEVICSRFHSLEQRLAKWMLLRLDEGIGKEVETTHQMIGSSLGYKREAITLALRRFHGIKVSRGKIQVNDRGRLERTTCSCYAAQATVNDNQLNLWQDANN
jgi:CRP-like cAMP-binding protein